MSESAAAPPRPPFDRSEDHVYFRAIEALFIGLRGAPFQLSPDDFEITRQWRADGVPLDVALATLREKVTVAQEKGDEPKRRLSYYLQAVEQAWQRQSELAAPGALATAEPLDIETRLRNLAARVPESQPAIRRRILDLVAGAASSAEVVDDELAAMDRDMLDLARDSLTDAARDELDRRLQAGMAALAGRLGGASESARRRAEVRLLRDVAELPLLSLFSPDAF